MPSFWFAGFVFPGRTDDAEGEKARKKEFSVFNEKHRMFL